MFCPFIIGGRPAYCSAGQTTYAPEEKESRNSCTNAITENYRNCRRYQRAVWSGLTPNLVTARKLEEEK